MRIVFTGRNFLQATAEISDGTCEKSQKTQQRSRLRRLQLLCHGYISFMIPTFSSDSLLLVLLLLQLQLLLLLLIYIFSRQSQISNELQPAIICHFCLNKHFGNVWSWFRAFMTFHSRSPKPVFKIQMTATL